MDTIKDNILSVSRPHRLHFAPAALSHFVKESSQHRDPSVFIDEVVAALTSAPTRGQVIGVGDIQQLCVDLNNQKSIQSTGPSGGRTVWALSAFEFPRVAVDRLSGTLSLCPGKVFSCPQDAMDQRLHFALERCLRSNLFQSRNAKVQSQKPAIYNLASLEGLSDESMKISALGHLTRSGEQWLLEDVSTSIPLEVDGSVVLPAAGILGDGCTVVVTGRWNGTVFHCDDVSFPPTETKETSRSAYRGIDLFGNESQPSSTSEDVLVVISQCHFDRQQSLDNLRRVMSEFEGRDESDLLQITFVLIGNFSTTTSVQETPIHMSTSESRGGTFHALCQFSAMVAASVPRVGAHSHFIFVPGPSDASPISGVLPQPPLGEEISVTTKLSSSCPKSVFMSNPCRLQIAGKEVTICRSDFSRSMSAPSVIGGGRVKEGAQPFEHIVKSIVDCRHLVPLKSTNPRVVWGLDSTLSLVTLPDLLILADSTDQWECSYAGTKVLNPGSFSSTTAFTWYSASDDEVTFNQLL